MSPEQIIVYARSADPGQTVVYHAEDKLLIAIRAAIRQARAEMREEAIKAAIGDRTKWPVHSEWANGYCDGKEAAAAAIRALEA